MYMNFHVKFIILGQKLTTLQGVNKTPWPGIDWILRWPGSFDSSRDGEVEAEVVLFFGKLKEEEVVKYRLPPPKRH